MRYSVAEKREIIHLVEHSELLIRQTLEELGVPRSSYYRWYQRFQEDGSRGLNKFGLRCRTKLRLRLGDWDFSSWVQGSENKGVRGR